MAQAPAIADPGPPVIFRFRLGVSDVNPRGRLARLLKSKFKDWSDSKILDLLSAYAQFMSLKIEVGDLDGSLLCPPALVGVCWQIHILDTLSYEAFCKRFAATTLHLDLFRSQSCPERIQATVNKFFEFYSVWPTGECWKFHGNPLLLELRFLSLNRGDSPGVLRKIVVDLETETVGNLRARVASLFCVDAKRTKLHLTNFAAQRLLQPSDDAQTLQAASVTEHSLIIVSVKLDAFRAPQVHECLSCVAEPQLFFSCICAFVCIGKSGL